MEQPSRVDRYKSLMIEEPISLNRPCTDLFSFRKALMWTA